MASEPSRNPAADIRPRIGLVLLLAGLETAVAASPPMDNSPGYFAGEWAGTGAQGLYCYLNLDVGGSGWVLVDGGSGDWQGARIQWHNQRQSLQIDKTAPLAVSTRLRVMPLEQFAIGGAFNQSLQLTLKGQPGACHLQKVRTTANHLLRARQAIEGLRSPANKR